MQERFLFFFFFSLFPDCCTGWLKGVTVEGRASTPARLKATRGGGGVEFLCSLCNHPPKGPLHAAGRRKRSGVVGAGEPCPSESVGSRPPPSGQRRTVLFMNMQESVSLLLDLPFCKF